MTVGPTHYGEELAGITIWEHVTSHVWERIDRCHLRSLNVIKLVPMLVTNKALLVRGIYEEARHRGNVH